MPPSPPSTSPHPHAPLLRGGGENNISKSREPGGKDSKGKTGDEHKKRATHNADTSSGDGDGDGSSGGGGGPKHPTPTPEEPLDFADVKSRIAQHDEHFAMSLKKLRSGGRFNPDVLGALRVEAPDAAKGTTYPLRELAQVVPRGGRTVSILAHEAAAVKPIMSAVRQRRDKLHASWQKEKALLPDLKKTADKELDKIIKAKMAEIDGAEKEALKVAESGTK
ncbi:putative ribosomal recycling factor protein [Eutypa lata UCREL1]|uniref:Putative ribosomal recycling factor protein n=1 Tax=Eutypa lata (strain UCR-EL1) TaxID=1287681 RepID=M7T6V8_EUTLA|nr:putative ribosomal recycling factor protein [Eutypa lata UCREL1]